MTFFYDLNKKIAALAGKQELTEGKKPDFLDVDKDGNKKESFKQAVKDAEAKKDWSQDRKDAAKQKGSWGGQVDEASYSAKAARAGKDIGKPGKAFSKIAKDAAERYGSKERGEKVAGAVLAKLRAKESVEEADMEEGNEFSGELAKARASGAKSFEVDGKEYAVKEDKKKKSVFDPEVARSMFAHKDDSKFDVHDTGYSKRYTRKHEEEPEDSDDDTPKAKGRKAVGAGKGKKIGAKVKGTSKLHKKGAIAEEGTDESWVSPTGNPDQSDIEQALQMLFSNMEQQAKAEPISAESIARFRAKLDQILASHKGQKPIAEKAVSQAQQKFMGMAHAIQKGEKVKGASPELKKVAKTMKKSDVTDFAKTKRSDLPKKVKDGEPVKEEGQEAPKSKKGGIQFGKGVYEAMNDNLERVISESINVNVSMTQDDSREPTKSITVTAEGDDAEMLAQLLNLAGLQGQSCSTCGQTPCGCEQMDEAYGDTQPTENTPDWPTDEETTGEDDALLRRWAGGLNKPKSTGQTTAPVVNRDPARGSIGPKEMAESAEKDLGMSLYAELKQFKG